MTISFIHPSSKATTQQDNTPTLTHSLTHASPQPPLSRLSPSPHTYIDNSTPIPTKERRERDSTIIIIFHPLSLSFVFVSSSSSLTRPSIISVFDPFFSTKNTVARVVLSLAVWTSPDLFFHFWSTRYTPLPDRLTARLSDWLSDSLDLIFFFSTDNTKARHATHSFRLADQRSLVHFTSFPESATINNK